MERHAHPGRLAPMTNLHDLRRRREDDDALLDRLGRALASEPASPTPAQEAVLTRLVAVTPPPAAPARSAHRRHRRWVAAGVAVMAVGAPAVAAASMGELPAPVRSVAHAVGLPVASVPLSEAQSSLDRLREALEVGDRAAIAAAAADLRRRIDRLPDGDRGRILPDAEPVLARADAATVAPRAEGPAGPSDRDRDGGEAPGADGEDQKTDDPVGNDVPDARHESGHAGSDAPEARSDADSPSGREGHTASTGDSEPAESPEASTSPSK